MMKKLIVVLVLSIICSSTVYSTRSIIRFTSNSKTENHQFVKPSANNDLITIKYHPSDSNGWDSKGSKLKTPGSHKGSDGLLKIIETGFVNGFTEHGFNFLKFNIIYGYQFNPFIGVGLGTGIKRDLKNAEYLLPFFMRVKANILNNKISPQFAIDLGYSRDFMPSAERYGFFGGAMLGACFKLNETNRLTFGLGYDLQRTSYWKGKYTPIIKVGNLSWNERDVSKGLSLNVCIEF